MDESRLLLTNDPSVPKKCEKCSSEVEYQGLGSYKCKECGHMMYDDYGKVRNYLDLHRGATAHEVAIATGVSQNKIRQMIREERFEIAQNSSLFLNCEICGISIRCGRYCDACSKKMLANDSRVDRRTTAGSMRGAGTSSSGSSGARRFSRD